MRCVAERDSLLKKSIILWIMIIALIYVYIFYLSIFFFPCIYVYIYYECGKYMKCDVNAYGGRDDKVK